jgi:hypothetical protein
MVVPAMQVANKVPDVYLQLWAASLLKGILQRNIRRSVFVLIE